MEQYQNQSRGTGRIGCKIAERVQPSDLTHDFTLPDYQPEVKRLLSVDAYILPADKYIGAGVAQLSGNVEYCILYMAPDGGIYSARETGEYQLSIPVEIPSEIDVAEGLLCLCDITPESTVGRVVAPRKLSVKCRLMAQMRLFGTRILEEHINGSARQFERLYKNTAALRLFAGRGESLALGDELLCETEKSGLRVIHGEGIASVSEATAGSGCVNCRGEVFLKLLCCADAEEGVPYTQTRRIPFHATVPVDGAEVNCMAHAEAACTDLRFTVEEGRILCEVTLLPMAYALRNEDITYTSDFYAVGADTTCRYTTVQLPHVLSLQSGNFSLNAMLTLEEAGIRPGQNVIDITLTPIATELEAARGKYTVSGKCRCRALLLGEGESGVQEFEVPFRYVADADREALSGYTVKLFPQSAKVRMDGERLGIDAELAVSICAYSNHSIEAFSEADITQPLNPTAAAYTVCYPSREDTLWSVSKRYHRAIEEVAAMNPLQDSPAADSLDSLAGVSYLLV